MAPLLPAPRVLKFGGAALVDGPGIRRCLAIVEQRGGSRPIVVVSAHGGVTRLLEDAAFAAVDGGDHWQRIRVRHRSLLAELGLDSELLDRYLHELSALLSQVRARGRLQPGELDYILSYGERMSARVVAHAFKASGRPATPVDAFDLGLITDSRHGGARPLPGGQERIRAALEEVPGVPVVTGFLAKDRDGNLTTLGRNGSDLTAALIAEAVQAEELQFWKAVAGVMTADPWLVPGARVIEHLSYSAAAEFAFHGSEILHPAAVEPALRAALPVRVLDVGDPGAPGTRIEVDRRSNGPLGVASQDAVAELAYPLGPAEERAAELARLFGVIATHGIEPRLVAVGGESARVVVLPRPGIEAVLEELGPRATLERGLAVVALIGHGVGEDRALVQAALSSLADAGIEVREAFTGSRLESQAFLVASGHLSQAVRQLHDALLPAPL